MNTIESWLIRPGGLAERLRELRKAAGLPGARMASDLGWLQSKVSKIETGRQMPSSENVQAWARRCDASTEVGDELQELLAEAQAIHQEWKQRVRLGQAPIQRSYDDLAQQATTIRNAEIICVPGLLQTPEFAAARIAEAVQLHGAPAQEVNAATAERIRRQQILYDTSKTFEFIITEAVLHILLCPPNVMLAQLDRLLSLTAGMPHITFGVIPFRIPLTITPQNSFILFDDLVMVETFAGETVHHGDEAATYAAAMDHLSSVAWTGDRARQLILQAANALRNSLS
jgi:transcriptional regulator with XRE-family HTH domain